MISDPLRRLLAAALLWFSIRGGARWMGRGLGPAAPDFLRALGSDESSYG